MSLSPETRFLLHAAVINPDSVHLEKIRASAAAVQYWDAVYNMAVSTGLGGLVYLSLKQAGYEDVPAVITKFKKIYRRYQHHNLKVLFVFDEIGQRLSKLDIPFIPLKGMAILQQLYTDPGMRYTSDIDLLFRRQDSEKYIKAFNASIIRHQPSSLFTRYISEAAAQKTFAKISERGIPIDLHEHLHSPTDILQFDIDHFWAKSSPVEHPESSQQHLSPAHQLIYMCSHLQRHLTMYFIKDMHFRMVWFLDIVEFIRKYRATIDWQALLTEAAAYKAADVVAGVVLVSHRYFSQLSESMSEEDLRSMAAQQDAKLTQAIEAGFLHHLDQRALDQNTTDYLIEHRKANRLPLTQQGLIRLSSWIPSKLYLESQFSSNARVIYPLHYPVWVMRRLKNKLTGQV
jgi:hypothetical protein